MTSSQGQWALTIVVVLVVLACIEWKDGVASMFQNGITIKAATSNRSNSVADGIMDHAATIIEADNDSHTKDPSELIQEHKKRFGGDLMDVKEIARLAKHARNQLIQQLQHDYGKETFSSIFSQDGKIRPAIVPVGKESTQRFKRKLEIKLLNVQSNIQQERIASTTTSDDQSTPPSQQHYYERMVWATGGHSAAAGHGNLFHQSYTASMERAVSGIFESIGIEFEGRNHAMGGTSSGPEISLCSEQVFGTDVDVLSWDYGMIDGKWQAGEAMYHSRAALNPNHPILVDLHVSQRRLNTHVNLLEMAQERGQASFYLHPEKVQAMEKAIPDTFGLSEEEINAMPPYVQRLKCQDQMEKGDPGCESSKFTNRTGSCSDRKGMVGWHPGW